MKDNLILIGMPGAGKSTIGVILAKTLAMDFVDGDLEICKETGTTLQDILDHQGKDAFLEIENRVICGLNPHHTVVATGGSVPLELPDTFLFLPQERHPAHCEALPYGQAAADSLPVDSMYLLSLFGHILCNFNHII